LEKDFQVCREGDELTPEQAKTLVRCTLWCANQKYKCFLDSTYTLKQEAHANCNSISLMNCLQDIQRSKRTPRICFYAHQ
jgi:hypothetical protein